jgi:hypothetical protein
MNSALGQIPGPDSRVRLRVAAAGVRQTAPGPGSNGGVTGVRRLAAGAVHEQQAAAALVSLEDDGGHD